jgi:hypothetical protein
LPVHPVGRNRPSPIETTLLQAAMASPANRPRRIIRSAGLAIVLGIFSDGCTSHSPHRGRLPFSLAEAPPRASGERMHVIARNDAPGTPAERIAISHLRAGDVVAFHMSQREAWAHLRDGSIQKIPYDLFRYGHVALVVPSPERSSVSADLRLLQIAMKQAANANEGTAYLEGKRWVAFRPPRLIDAGKLHEFTRRVITTGSDPKQAYDYLGVLGIRNAPCQPDTLSTVGGKFGCATLVVAGLHYSGCPLAAVRRDGWFDIVTPAQVISSRVQDRPR